MKLIALLCWYDEPVSSLVELIASLARADVDQIVAVDGAYALFPGGRAQSRYDQAQAIIAAARGAQMGLTMHCPLDVWFGNEVEKRTFAFRAGHLAGEPGDWLWVCDADEVVTEAHGLRAALAKTPFEVGEVVLDQVTADGPQGQLPIRKLFRVQPSGIRVEGNHYTYVAGDGRTLWSGMYANPWLVPAEPLSFVRVEHRQTGRPADRVRAHDRYYQIRKETNAELEAA